MEELELYSLILKGMVTELSEEDSALVANFKEVTEAVLEIALEGSPEDVKCKCIGMILACIEKAEEITEVVN